MKTLTMIRNGMFAAIGAACLSIGTTVTAPAQAGTITSNFTITLDDGILTGETGSGSVTWDDTFLNAAGDGFLTLNNGLIDLQLQFSFFGNFDAADDEDSPQFPGLSVSKNSLDFLDYRVRTQYLGEPLTFVLAPNSNKTVQVNIDLDRDGSPDDLISSGIYSFTPTLTPTAIPTPALLPGLVGLGVAVWRKRKTGAAQDSTEG